jgi:hypothetical protein
MAEKDVHRKMLFSPRIKREKSGGFVTVKQFRDNVGEKL